MTRDRVVGQAFSITLKHFARVQKKPPTTGVSVTRDDYFSVRKSFINLCRRLRPGRDIGIFKVAFSGALSFDETASKKNFLGRKIGHDVIEGVACLVRR